MAKTVSFGMFWETYARQTITLPDDIDENDADAIIAYIKENWDDVSIPVSSGSYVMGSDHLDEESMICIE